MRIHKLLGISLAAVLILASATRGGLATASERADTFDQEYAAYHQLLRNHVAGTRVDYAALKRNRVTLDRVVDSFGGVTRADVDGWSREEQIAFWINAYNAFTLQAIVDHYPIDGGWLSFLRFAPRSSIRQIDGVWDERRWPIAGARMTLDEIEHNTLRADYDEPRIHFAVNCASISCPPLRAEPYVGARLERQLILAARTYLATDQGLQVDGTTLWVSSIFDWYGDDFVDQYGHLVDGASAKERAILGVVAKYGPGEASGLAQAGRARIRFLRYDWGLNDVTR